MFWLFFVLGIGRESFAPFVCDVYGELEDTVLYSLWSELEKADAEFRADHSVESASSSYEGLLSWFGTERIVEAILRAFPGAVSAEGDAGSEGRGLLSFC